MKRIVTAASVAVLALGLVGLTGCGNSGNLPPSDAVQNRDLKTNNGNTSTPATPPAETDSQIPAQ